jgi:hypothetical protein
MARSLSMSKEVDEKEKITKTKNSLELSGQIFRPSNPLGKVAQKFTDRFK